MPKSDSIWILEKETVYFNGEKITDEVGYYTMKALATIQTRYLNGTVPNEDKSTITYSSREVRANHDFSR